MDAFAAMMMLLAANDVVQTGAGTALKPAMVLALCVLAGVGTWWLLPSRKSINQRQLGGALVAIAGAIFAVLLIRFSLGSSNKPGISYWYFWIFSAVALAGSVRVITHPKPVYSALYFVLTVFASAGLFILMWAEFMAAAIVLIYAGAILVTYVFVIMLASEASGVSSTTGDSSLPEHDSVARSPFAACLVGFALMGVILFVVFDKSQAIAARAEAGDPIASGNTQQLGAFLFRHHFVNVQMAGLLLTLAMIGAIMIARKRIIRGEGSAAELAAATSPLEIPQEVVLGPATPINDDPHSIPVVGTENPAQKVYPEN